MVAATDIVHVHALWEEPQYLAMATAAKLNRAAIVRPCGMLNSFSLSQSNWKKRVYLAWRGRTLLKTARAIHCTSHSEAANVQQVFRRAPTLVIPNGIRRSEFEHLPPHGTFRARMLNGFAGPFALHLGRIAPKKNLQFAIDAFAQANVAGSRLIFIGPAGGEHATQLQKRGVAELGDRFQLLPPIFGPDRFAALRDASVFIIPSLDENFANSLLEAMAVGTPAFASPKVGLAEEGQNLGAAEILPLEIDVWSKALRDALSTGHHTSHNRDRVLKQFDWKRIAAEWASHYEGFVDADRPRYIPS